MPKFIVKNTPILHNGKRYEIGDKIEMTAEEAENNALYLQADEDEAARLAAEKAEAERLAEEEKARLAAEEAEKEVKKTAKSKEK